MQLYIKPFNVSPELLSNAYWLLIFKPMSKGFNSPEPLPDESWPSDAVRMITLRVKLSTPLDIPGEIVS